MSLPESASFKDFARLAGVKPSYVTQLRHDGRLVLTEDGKRVLVAESLQRIADTKDPSKVGVAARHAQERGEPVTPPPAGAGDNAEDREPDNLGFQEARARKEHWLAKAAQRDYEISTGKLLNADLVTGQVRDIVARLRSALELLPDTLGAELAAEHDEARCRALLGDAIQHELAELSRQFAKLVTPESSA